MKLDSKTKRFFYNNSIYHESTFELDEKSLLQLPNVDFKFKRTPAYEIPGLKQAKSRADTSDRQELYRKIITGKQKVHSIKEILM